MQHKIWTVIIELCYTYLLSHVLFPSDTILEMIDRTETLIQHSNDLMRL